MNEDAEATIDHHTQQQMELHIAPMLDVSTPEFHTLFRILSKKCILWTEMVVDETIVFTEYLDQHLKNQSPAYNYEDGNSLYNKHPIICQIGGRNVEYCAKATRIIEQEYAYDEINLNIDCPSSRVSGEREFGAALMKQPDAAIDVVKTMNDNTINIPVSVKTRVGIDDFDTLEHIIQFISRLRNEAGCRKFIIHARKCLLCGLSPAQNRLVPPLNYPRVYEICKHFPDCEFVLNGGIPGLKAAKILAYGTESYKIDEDCCSSPDDVQDCQDDTDTDTDGQLEHAVPCSLCKASNGSCTSPLPIAPSNLRGCMLGRAARENPSMFWDVDRYIYGMDKNPCSSRREVLMKYCEYLEQLYPRRCCDDDERITSLHFPTPKIVSVENKNQYCHICQSVYQPKSVLTDLDDELNNVSESEVPNTAETTRSKKKKAKITGRTIDQALRPILGIFFGMHGGGSKRFRRTIYKLSRDMTVRNCGPGFLLRKAMNDVPVELLDMKFAKTEDLNEEDVPLHVGPAKDSSSSYKC